MHAAVMPGALVVAAMTVPIACGVERQAAQPPSTDYRSARVSDVTTYLEEGVKREEVITGAFDWAKSEGWSEERYGGGAPGFMRQVGSECFSREGNGEWTHWHEAGKPPLCDSDVFQPAGKLLEYMRSQGKLETVGEEKIGGVKTTRFRFVPRDYYFDEPEAWLEVWLDESEVVRKLRRPAGEASPRVREYSDFGVEVHVTPPCRWVPAASSPSTTLTQEERNLKPCVEEVG